MKSSIRKTEIIRDNGTWRLNVTPTMKGHEVYGMEKKIRSRHVLIRIFHNCTDAFEAWYDEVAAEYKKNFIRQ